MDEIVAKTVQCIIRESDKIPTQDQVLANRVHVLLDETEKLWISKTMQVFMKDAGNYVLVEVKMPPMGDYFVKTKTKITWNGHELSAMDVSKIRHLLAVMQEFFGEDSENKK